MLQAYWKNWRGSLTSITFLFISRLATLRHRLVHPKDKTSREKQRNAVYAVQPEANAQGCTLEKQNKSSSSTRETPLDQESSVHLHLNDKDHLFDDSNRNVKPEKRHAFDREVKWTISASNSPVDSSLGLYRLTWPWVNDTWTNTFFFYMCENQIRLQIVFCLKLKLKHTSFGFVQFALSLNVGHENKYTY